jgi:hypothetical protein
MNNWLDLSDNANTFLSTIVDGFVDTSGGNIIVRENQHLEVSGDASFNQGCSFAVPTLKTDVIDTTGLVELSISKTEFVENPSFIQYAYDISGAESGGLAGQSISKNLAGDIIAVGAPLNSGGGTARGEVRVYQKNNDSWLQLGNDLNGEADNDEFGHSVDLNGDGTILAVGTKDVSNNLIIYQYDGSVWSQKGNNIHVVNNNIFYDEISLTTGTKVKLNKEGNKLVTMNKYNASYQGSVTSLVTHTSPYVTHGCTNNWDFRVNSSTGITDDIGDIVVTYEGGGTSNVTDGFESTYTSTYDPVKFMYVQPGLTFGGECSVEIYMNAISIPAWGRLFRWSVVSVNNLQWCRYSDLDQYYVDNASSGGKYFNCPIVAGQFDHLVLTITSDGTGKLYYNGSLQETQTGINMGSVGTLSSSTDACIGCYGSSNGVTRGTNIQYKYLRYYHGKVLSQSEVDDLYNDRDDTSTASGANGTIAENSQSQVTEVSTINVVEGVVQTYEYSASDVSWNQIGNTIESASVNDISGGDIAINDEGNMITIGYPQSKSSIQGTYSYSVIPGADSNANLLYEFFGEEFTSDTDKPVLTFKRGSTYNLTISTGGSHPFYIQTTDNGGSYDSANVYNNGVTNNGTGSGILTFVVPSDAPDTLYYVCQYHGNMGNSISIVNESGNGGRTKVFKYDTTDSSWNQVGNNIDGEGQAGTAVVMDGSGDFVAIGSPNVNAGEVNVYQNVADTWTLYGNKIEGQADNDEFGTSLDMTPAGNILAVGAPNANGGKGNINIYQYNTTDSSWNQLGGDLSGDAVGDLTGTSVKLNQLGNEVSIGEPTSNLVLPQPHSNAFINWNFAQNITTSTIGGDTGTEGTFRSGTADSTVNVTLTESEGFEALDSEPLRVTVKDYIFPTDSFTIEIYCKLSSSNPGVNILEYGNSGVTTARLILGRVSQTQARAYLVDTNSSGTNLYFDTNIDWQLDTWYHAVYVCDMANASGPTISMYQNGVFDETKSTSNTDKWNREITGRELGLPITYDLRTHANDTKIKRLQIIDGLLDATEVAALYDNRESQASTLGGARTFEIEHTKFYNGMTNPTFGIGVTNPTNRLDVDGTVYIDGKLQTTNLSQTSGTTTVSGDLTLNGSISVDAVNNSSLTYDTDMSVNLLKRLFVNPNDISSYGETTQTHASDVVDTSVPPHINQIGDDILVSNATINDNYGYSSDINGDGTIIAVGAPYNNDIDSLTGKVLMYQYDSGQWNSLGDITGYMVNSYGIRLGSGVSLNYSGTRVAIGAYYDYTNGTRTGSVQCWEYSNSTWNQLGNTFAYGGNNYELVGDLGQVAINKNTDSNLDGKYICTSSYNYHGTGSSFGRTRVYEWNGSAWNQIGNDIIGDSSYEGLGRSCSINNDGTVIVTGNYLDDDNANNSGSIKAWEYDSGTGSWSKKGSTIHGLANQDYFGVSVAINGDGSIIAGYADGNDSNGNTSGLIRIYQFINNDWTQIGQNIYGDTSSSGTTGNAIALNNTGHRILIGFYYNDDNGSNTGGGRIYDYNSSTGLWNQLDEEIHGPLGANGGTGSLLGYSVGLNYDGTKFCLGAPDYKNSSGTDTGMVRAYEVVPSSASQTFSEDLSFNHSLIVPGNLVIVDGSNNTNYGSYTTYTSTDVDNYAAAPTNKSYHVGKSKSNVFNIVNQDNIGVYMNTGDTSFTSTSDERLKHNIQHTENSLEKICALQPRKFKWKYNDKSESGFIAQEIEKVFPEMVDENTLPDGKTIKGVNHSSLLPYILDSLQSLDKEIDDLIEE